MAWTAAPGEATEYQLLADASEAPIAPFTRCRIIKSGSEQVTERADCLW